MLISQYNLYDYHRDTEEQRCIENIWSVYCAGLCRHTTELGSHGDTKTRRVGQYISVLFSIPGGRLLLSLF